MLKEQLESIEKRYTIIKTCFLEKLTKHTLDAIESSFDFETKLMMDIVNEYRLIKQSYENRLDDNHRIDSFYPKK